ARNAEYLDANYGGVLIVFDRLFGTYIAERKDVPCDFGLVSPDVSSRNPLDVNFGPWIGLAKDIAAARTWREAWMYLFGPPGWRPNGEGLTTTEIRRRAGLISPALQAAEETSELTNDGESWRRRPRRRRRRPPRRRARHRSASARRPPRLNPRQCRRR